VAGLRFIFQAPKTDRSHRTIPIPADIVEVLQRHKARQAQERLLLGAAYEDHGLVFCAAIGGPTSPPDFYKAFVRWLQRAGLPRVRFHDMRHTFATLMPELGESAKTVQAMLGHTTITTTLAYLQSRLFRPGEARRGEAERCLGPGSPIGRWLAGGSRQGAPDGFFSEPEQAWVVVRLLSNAGRLLADITCNCKKVQKKTLVFWG